MKILGIIPARKGSKGIKNKNLYTLSGKPLIYYAIKEAKRCSDLDRVIVSTDSSEIQELSIKYGAEAPFLRPKQLASDSAKSIDVVLHALNYLKNKECYEPDLIVLLQATAPLRKSFHIGEALKILKAKKGDSVVSLCKLDEPHPFKLKLIRNNKVESFIKGADSSIPRQKLPEVYRLNGAIYAAYTSVLLEKKSFFGDKVIPFVMKPEYSVNIDTILDFEMAEIILKKLKK